jgi:molybdate transport system substrate-binding protein
LRRALAGIVALALMAAGCGGGKGEGSDKPTIKVSAASSLKQAFQVYGKSFEAATVSFSFAGSDELAAQIRQGVKPDAYAAANTKLPHELYVDRLVEKPIRFASNQLVIAVPDGSRKVRAIADLAKPGVRIAAGAPTVPIGSYTRDVLRRLPSGEAQAIEGNIRSNEPDVAGIVGKVAQGAVDAGFVYVTDVRAAGERLAGIPLSSRLQPRVTYSAAVVSGAPHPAEARKFVEGLRHAAAVRALQAAGFDHPGG